MRLLFWRKKKRQTAPILDGIKEVQLYICPTCGEKAEDIGHCKCCGRWVCSKCWRELNFWLRGRYDTPNFMGTRVCKACGTQLSTQFAALWDALKKTKTGATEEAAKMA